MSNLSKKMRYLIIFAFSIIILIAFLFLYSRLFNSNKLVIKDRGWEIIIDK